MANGNTNDTDDVLGDDHSSTSDQEQVAATVALDHPEGEGGGADVDEGCDEGDEEGIGDCVETVQSQISLLS